MSRLRIETEIHDEQFHAAVRSVASRAMNPRAVMDDIGEEWVARTQRRFDRGGEPTKWKPKWDGCASHLRTNARRLERSIHHRSTRTTVRVGTPLKYGRIHQEGGVIRPRRRRYLSIPLKKGSPYRGGAGALMRRYPDRTFLYFPSSKYGVVMRKSAKGRKAEPVFLLVKKVKIPARPFLMATPGDVAAFKHLLSTFLVREAQ